jgi:hypothetical protein
MRGEPAAGGAEPLPVPAQRIERRVFLVQPEPANADAGEPSGE